MGFHPATLKGRGFPAQVFYKEIDIVVMECDEDHLHLLVGYSPNQSILEIVRHFKQLSTYRIWRQNENYLALSRQFWKKRTFWSDGYFACSIGNASQEVIQKYIESQG